MNYETLAETIRHGLALDARASPFAYAKRMHLEIQPANACARGAELIDRTIRWDARLPQKDQLRAVAREVCRWALRASSRDEADDNVDALLAALFTSCAFDSSSTMKPPKNVRYLRVLPRRSPATNKAAASPPAPPAVRPWLRRPATGARRP